jgi:hypoxanthine phosphoribosyltransferase
MENERDLRDMTVEKVKVTWDDVDAFITLLEPLISSSNFTGVYGPPRGGLIFAVIISHKYNLPFLGAPQKGCLVVDDIIDTGDTAKAWANKGYKIASMYYNTASCVVPDYFMRYKENKWIVYPWEA